MGTREGEGYRTYGRNNIPQLAVVSDGNLEDVFSQAQVLRFLPLHAGLHQGQTKWLHSRVASEPIALPYIA
ncbi:MAG TPA: hypothetical protein VEI49_07360 [Terriglobales bacterium]|nr:hypothetical protein [Terriglobales bacterium]